MAYVSGRQPRQAPARARRAHGGRDAPDPARGRRRARLRPRPRRGASRHQAGQHPARRDDRPPDGHRLRHRARDGSSGDSRLTATGMAIGTPAYMSPEQAAGEREIDGRSDLYSLGILGYQMLTGEPPFTAGSTPAMLVKHISERPIPVEQRRADVPHGPRALGHDAAREGSGQSVPVGGGAGRRARHARSAAVARAGARHPPTRRRRRRRVRRTRRPPTGRTRRCRRWPARDRSLGRVERRRCAAGKRRRWSSSAGRSRRTCS